MRGKPLTHQLELVGEWFYLSSKVVLPLIKTNCALGSNPRGSKNPHEALKKRERQKSPLADSSQSPSIPFTSPWFLTDL